MEFELNVIHFAILVYINIATFIHCTASSVGIVECADYISAEG